MKTNTLLFTVLILILTFSSCNDDEDSSTDPDFSNLIVGIWEIDKQLLNDNNLDFEDECQAIETTEFKMDGTFYITELDPVGEDCVEANPSLGNWTIQNSTITMNYSQVGDLTVDETYIFEILELSDSNLKIKTDSVDIDGDGEADDFELQYVK
ncbi:lipocalin family protein [Algibacter lectus]|uniref:lipocalin family protein n=1 Tax=Algibacter lectus TaxID=221126 RepID=UPI0026E9A8EB|nr:lipocalin family protein [Algibacter lectus]MDO7136708.1 lipocalin family protein [Algibacter lectus]